ncbi:hypothetical protein KMZ93_21440 [Bradyrhizobium sediminis]|uniref:Uncharacterized protein n=1 Tax=Bradyrhizobium sediminis TaxID=2840469 RepID=A0A975RX07_9BRAD|nr:hypothetical protein [Bradyrhizobium sediminis]QWG22501.1 hypothetical protein KMZ93_21440 [Bradyrhizobium sediminis]
MIRINRATFQIASKARHVDHSSSTTIASSRDWCCRGCQTAAIIPAATPKKKNWMLMRNSLFVLLSLVMAAGAASAEEASVDLAGIGGRTCAYWLSSRDHRQEGTVWIYGFWSGLNYVAASSQQDQSKASDATMIATVEAACKGKPSRILATAAWSAYIDSSGK